MFIDPIEFIEDLPLSKYEREERDLKMRLDILLSALRTSPGKWALFASCETSNKAWQINNFISGVEADNWYRYEFKEISREVNEIEFYGRAISQQPNKLAKKKFWRRALELLS